MSPREGALAQLLLSLDRCQHGRHSLDPCLSCPSGISQGNPHLRTGQKIGYDVHARPLFVPERQDFTDPAQWRQLPPDPTRADSDHMSEVYRERNRLVAMVISAKGWPAVLTPAPDAEKFWIVFANSEAGQISFHIPERDLCFFDDVPRVEEWDWDGHTTAQKFDRMEWSCKLPGGRA